MPLPATIEQPLREGSRIAPPRTERHRQHDARCKR